jgi:hypothetical protein
MSETRSEERARKRSASGSCNPLRHRGILQLVLEYVGPGEHVFLSTVSKGFRTCYLNIPTYKLAYSDPNDNDIEIKIVLVHHMTTSSAVLAPYRACIWHSSWVL